MAAARPCAHQYCYNCRKYTVHSAMYCNNAPQAMLRCETCWNSISKLSEHAFHCIEQSISEILGPNDARHRKQPRLLIQTSEPKVKRYSITKNQIDEPSLGLDYVSLSDFMTYKWNSRYEVEVDGPRTMYFRVYIVNQKTILFRIDVLSDHVKVCNIYI